MYAVVWHSDDSFRRLQFSLCAKVIELKVKWTKSKHNERGRFGIGSYLGAGVWKWITNTITESARSNEKSFPVSQLMIIIAHKMHQILSLSLCLCVSVYQNFFSDSLFMVVQCTTTFYRRGLIFSCVSLNMVPVKKKIFADNNRSYA